MFLLKGVARAPRLPNYLCFASNHGACSHICLVINLTYIITNILLFCYIWT